MKLAALLAILLGAGTALDILVIVLPLAAVIVIGAGLQAWVRRRRAPRGEYGDPSPPASP
jgi:hypothetical protein